MEERQLVRLVERAKTDETAFEQVVAQLTTKLDYIVRRYGFRSPQDARQLALVGLWKAVKDWKPGSASFSTFASKYMINAARKSLYVSQIDRYTVYDVDLEDPMMDVLNGIEVGQLLDLLPPRQRQVIELRYGLTEIGPLLNAEISDELNIASSTVQSTHDAALKTLRKHEGLNSLPIRPKTPKRITYTRPVSYNGAACIEDDCDAPATRKQKCDKHYRRDRRLART